MNGQCFSFEFKEQINKAKENAPRKSLLEDDDDDESDDEPAIGPLPVTDDQSKKEYGTLKRSCRRRNFHSFPNISDRRQRAQMALMTV